MRRVVHRQHDAGRDHDHQDDPGQRAEIPPVVEVDRRRVGAVRSCSRTREDRQHGSRSSWIIRPIRLSGQPAGWQRFPRPRACLLKFVPWRFLADLDRGVGGEVVGRHDRGSAAPDPGGCGRRCRRPSRGTGRTSRRSRPAVVAGLLPERDAAEMRAHADHDEPFRLLDARRIRLRVAQFGDVDVLRRLDLLAACGGR